MGGTLAISPAFGGCSLAETFDIARAAAGWGYTSAWADEVVGHDCFAMLGALSREVDLDLGVAVAPVQTRSAFVLGRAALTLAELTGGRFSLGIGASSEVLVTRFAGLDWDKPLTHVRETTEALRAILAGQRATVEGEKVRIGGFKYGLPAPTPVPLLLGSLNPKSLQMAGAIADGLCLNQLAPRHVPVMLEEVRRGAEEAGRALPDDFPVVARLMVVVTDDAPAARQMLKGVFAPYAATTGYNRFFRWIGYEEEATAIAEAAERGDRAAMIEAYSDEMANDLLVIGNADEVATKVRAYLDAGVTIAAIEPLAPGVEAATMTLKAASAALD